MSRLFAPCHALCLLLLWLMAAQVFAAPPRAELLPGADRRDWLLIIEADGERRSNELAITPLLRQFAVGKVTMSRISAPRQNLTRWQIPLHLLDTSPQQVPALPLGGGADSVHPLSATQRSRQPGASACCFPHRTAGPGAATGAALPRPAVCLISSASGCRLTWRPPTSPSRPAMPSPFAASATISGSHRRAPVCPAA